MRPCQRSVRSCRSTGRQPLESRFLPSKVADRPLESTPPVRASAAARGVVAALLVVGAAVACAGPPSGEVAEQQQEPRSGSSATASEQPVVARDDGAAADEKRGLLERFFGPEEREVVVPAGTVLQVSLGETLSSHDTAVGERFDAVLLRDVAIDGVVAVPAGSRLGGRVTEATPARKIGGRARLTLVFEELDLGDRQVPIAASIAQVGRSERAKDAAIIGGGTIAGAVLGEEVDDGDGGVIGAIVGGLAGTAAAKKTHGKPVVLEAGTEVSVRLESPVELTVTLDT
jgi:hypothetical protein